VLQHHQVRRNNKIKEENMEITNREIFESRNAIQELLRYKLPIKPSMQVAKLSRKVNELLKDIDVVRKGLIEKYGEKNEKGGMEVKQTNEHYPVFMSEFNELLSLNVQITVEKVRMPEMIPSTCDFCHHNMDKKLEIEPWILAALEKFIDVA